MSEPYILFIASWYPDETDPTLGIFIRRHAEAVALYRHVKVLYMKPADGYMVTRKTNGNIEEIEVRYRNTVPRLSMHNSFRKAVKHVINEQPPMIVHAHVTLPAGFLASMIHGHTGIPYLVTEHWTGYLSRDGRYKGFMMKYLTHKALKRAAYITPVSYDLMDAMNSHGLKGNYKVIPNVAHPVYFNEPMRASRRKFIHISSLDERQKNISGILKAFRKIQDNVADAELIIAGDGPDRGRAEKHAAEIGLRNITFTGNLDAGELAKHISESAALILFSNFENLPCVIIESFACGTPVISTNVGGINEIISHENGVLIKAGDEDALFNSMMKLLTPGMFDRDKIRKEAFEKFSYDRVGKAYLDLYETMTR